MEESPGSTGLIQRTCWQNVPYHPWTLWTSVPVTLLLANLFHRAVAVVLLRNLQEMQTLGPHSGSVESELAFHLSKIHGRFVCLCSSVRSTDLANRVFQTYFWDLASILRQMELRYWEIFQGVDSPRFWFSTSIKRKTVMKSNLGGFVIVQQIAILLLKPVVH